MIPQIVLPDEGMTTLFDLHPNRQEWEVKERSVHVYICLVRFFYFQTNYSNPV